MFFSIAIPTYEMHGMGVHLLEHSFEKLKSQVFKDFDVVISDHSKDDDIKNLCERWKNHLDVKYFRYDEKFGNSSANLNNAISKCSGDWIKIIFQDDYLFDEKSLHIHRISISEYGAKHWIASATERSKDGINVYMPHCPRWNNDMVYGVNTISSPSVICFKNEFDKNLKFDERLIWLMDVEFYHRMYQKYGEPNYIYNITVVNRTWENQISSNISGELIQEEHKLIENEYPR